MKHLLKLGGMTPEEILHILDVADEYKRLHKDGVDPKDLQGKAVALVFAKNSTRTRTSLEVGIYQMGGLGTYLSASDLQTARGEPVQDTARVLGRYYDAIVCRTYKQTTLDMLAKYSGFRHDRLCAPPAGADRPDDRARAQGHAGRAEGRVCR